MARTTQKRWRFGRLLKGDTTIWVMFVALTFISLVAVYSSIGRTAIDDIHTTPLAAFVKHAVFVFVGYLLVIIISNINYRKFSRIAQLVYWLALGVLVVMVVLNRGRWIYIRGFGSFQPSEVAKVALIMFVARDITLHRERLQELNFFIRILIYIALVVAFILPDNYSTAALVALVCMIVLYFGGVNHKYWWRTLGIAVVAGGILLVLSYNVYTNGKGNESSLPERALTWGHRVDSWLHPDSEELTQENMARMAVASGRLVGVGVGHTIHARLMTQASNDFIYAIIIEETGMAMGIIVFVIYAVFYFRCITLARRCKGLFGSLILVGYGTLIFFQAVVNMFVSVGVLPVTGQTLPLISYGGTSYLCMCIAVGAIQSVANDIRKTEQAIKDKQRNEAEFEELKMLDEKVNG